jgi:hypothetical protein
MTVLPQPKAPGMEQVPAAGQKQQQQQHNKWVSCAKLTAKKRNNRNVGKQVQESRRYICGERL